MQSIMKPQVLRGVARATLRQGVARTFHASPVAAKKGDISASELSSILQEKIEGLKGGVSIDEASQQTNGIALVLVQKQTRHGSVMPLRTKCTAIAMAPALVKYSTEKRFEIPWVRGVVSGWARGACVCVGGVSGGGGGRLAL